ncbi:Increased DNA methylation 3 [Linum perenne]
MNQQQQNGAPVNAVTPPFTDGDKLFVANFIVANYLAPDVYSDDPPKPSAAQRLSQRFPPYTPAHLGQSSLTITQIQRLYLFILRNSNPSLIFTQNQFYFYLKGKLVVSPYPSVDFTTFFPLDVHKQKVDSTTGHEVVKGIVVIDHDSVSGWVDCEDLDRFKRLTGLVELKIDRESWLSYDQSSFDHDRVGWLVTNSGMEKCKMRTGRTNRIISRNTTTMTTLIVHGKPVTFELFGLLWDSVVIGIGSTAYLFRVALPPLPNNRGLSCEISWDGKVEINHLGEPTVTKSFNLPGPVEPRLFSAQIRSDGIFEAIVVKQCVA